MKTYKIIILIIFTFLVFVGCGGKNENDALFEEVTENSLNSKEEEKDSENSGKKLTIAAYADYSIQFFIKNYKEKYPEIEIELTDYYDWTMTKTDEEYAELSKKNLVALENFKVKMSTEIMSGKGPDIINMGPLDRYKYEKQGVFVDFYSLMENDERYNKEDYYTNIFKNLEYEESLYNLPFGVDMDLIYLNKAEHDKLGIDYTNMESITPEEMIKTYKQTLSQSSYNEDDFLLSEYTGDSFKKTVFNSTVYPGYFDRQNDKADFNNDDFINYLELTNTLKTKYQPDKFNSSYMFSSGLNKLENFENFLYCFASYSSKIHTAEETTEYYGPIKTTNIQGQNLFRVNNSYSIPKSSKNIDLAWDFLYYCIDEQEYEYSKMLDVDLFKLSLSELQNLIKDESGENAYMKIFDETILYSLIPLNKSNFKNTVYFSYYSEYFNLLIGTLRGHYEAPRFNTKEELDENINKVAGIIEEHINAFDTEMMPDLEILKSIEQDSDNFYYYNDLSKEELVEIVDKKMNIYLTE